MSSHAKFNNNSFLTDVVSGKFVKRTFFTIEPLPENFSKILFYGNQVSHSAFLYAEFHDPRSNSLGREESHRNPRNRRIRTSLASVCLNKCEII